MKPQPFCPQDSPGNVPAMWAASAKTTRVLALALASSAAGGCAKSEAPVEAPHHHHGANEETQRPPGAKERGAAAVPGVVVDKLDDKDRALHLWFNARADKTRLVMILSPT